MGRECRGGRERKASPWCSEACSWSHQRMKGSSRPHRSASAKTKIWKGRKERETRLSLQRAKPAVS